MSTPKTEEFLERCIELEYDDISEFCCGMETDLNAANKRIEELEIELAQYETEDI